MLIDFYVKNFYSFGEKELFSLKANNRIKHHEERIFQTSIKSLNLLPFSIIYGANASGKTNLIRAILSFHIIFNNDEVMEGLQHKLAYHILNPKYFKIPSEYTIIFYINNHIVEYSINFVRNINNTLIIKDEILSIQKSFNSSKTVIFKRELKDTEYKYNFSEALRNNKTYIEGIKQLTPETKALLSTIAQHSSQQTNNTYISVIQELHKKLKFIDFIDNQYMLFDKNNRHRYLQDKNYANKVIKLVKAIDVNVENISIEINEDYLKTIKDNFLKNKIQFDQDNYGVLDTYFVKDINKKLKPMPLPMISSGTRGAFTTFLKVVEVLENGSILLVDEIERSLHPHVVELIIEIFNNKKINKNGAQLIATTHNTTFLNEDLLRKDQIFFIEKENLESKIYRLDEFENNRKGSNIEKQYKSGRFGAIPNIEYLEDIFDEEEI